MDAKHRATCAIQAKEQLTQNLTLMAAWRILQWPDRRYDASGVDKYFTG